MGVSMKLGRSPDIFPAVGRELFRERNDGSRVLLTGYDYNREAMKRQIMQFAASRPELRADAVGLALEEDLRHRKAQFWDQPQRPLVASEFVPMDPEAAAFADAEEYSWEVRTPYGEAQMHASLNGVTEAPDVSEGAEHRKVPIVNAVVSYGWNVQDELVGSRIGYSYATRRAQLARNEIARAFDKFLLTGGTFSGKTFEGLFNLSEVTTFDADVSGTGQWYLSGTTVQNIKDDFRNLYDNWLAGAYKAGSANSVDAPDTVAMSDRLESLLRHRPVGTDNRMSVLDELKATYPEITNWLVHRDLRGINGSSADDRVVMYKRDPMVVAGAVPVAYQEQPIMQTPYGQKVYAFGRVAPVEPHILQLIQYLDVETVAP